MPLKYSTHNEINIIKDVTASLHLRIAISTKLCVGMEAFISGCCRNQTAIFNCRAYIRILFSLLLLSNDVSVNPSPQGSHMCGACNNQVNTSNHNIKCDFCDRRYHVYCSRDELILVEFMNTSCLWICSDCGLPSFSSSLLDSPNIAETSNSFSAIGSSASSTSAWDMSLDPSDCTIHSKDLPSISTPINHRQRQKVNHKIEIMTINCRSLRSDSKRSAFTALVDTYKPDIINATETHLDSSVFSAELGLDNYDVFCKDRNIHGGGVLIAVKNNLIASRELELEREELESVWCKLQISGSKTLYNCCFYRKTRSSQRTY